MAEQGEMISRIEVQQAVNALKEDLNKSVDPRDITLGSLEARAKQVGRLQALEWVLREQNEMTDEYSRLMMQSMMPSIVTRAHPLPGRTS